MIEFPGYELSFESSDGNIIYTEVLEDPECLRMEVDMLLEQFDEVSIRKKK